LLGKWAEGRTTYEFLADGTMKIGYALPSGEPDPSPRVGTYSVTASNTFIDERGRLHTFQIVQGKLRLKSPNSDQAVDYSRVSGPGQGSQPATASAGLGLLDSKPSSVVKQYYQLGQQGKIDEVVKLYSPVVLGALRGAGMDPRASFGAYFQDVRAKGGISALTVEDDGVQGDTAYVRIVMRFGNGSTEQGRERLKRFGGTWLLAPPTAEEQFGR
jgi:hypothetical protein